VAGEAGITLKFGHFRHYGTQCFTITVNLQAEGTIRLIILTRTELATQGVCFS
jgi:hypothetical protein